jgi:hypothetical protein
MTSYTLPLLGLLILAPLPAGAAPDQGAPDTPGTAAERAAAAQQRDAPAAKSEAKPKSKEEAPAATAGRSDAKPESKQEAPAATKGKPESKEEAPAATKDKSESKEEGPAATKGKPESKEEAPAATKGKPESKEEAPAAIKGKSESKEAAPAATKGKPKDGAAAQPAATKEEPPAPPPPQAVVDPAAAAAATTAATGYLTALKEKGFAAAPAWLHPAALARFKDLVMPRLKDEQARGTRTLLNATFGRDAGYPAAAAADPADFLTRFARLISAREPDAAPRFSGLTPLGVLREGEQLHVLIRLTLGGGPEAVERIEVVSLLPQDKDLKVLLDGRLQSLASTLGSQPRTDGPRGPQLRLEPLPEGLPPAPAAPAGPAGPQPTPPTLPAPR